MEASGTRGPIDSGTGWLEGLPPSALGQMQSGSEAKVGQAVYPTLLLQELSTLTRP